MHVKVGPTVPIVRVDASTHCCRLAILFMGSRWLPWFLVLDASVVCPLSRLHALRGVAAMAHTKAGQAGISRPATTTTSAA